MFYQELINYIVDWCKCRKWRPMFWMSLPLSLVLIAFLAIVGYGYFSFSDRALIRHYVELAEEEMASVDTGTAQKQLEESTSNSYDPAIANLPDSAPQASPSRLFEDTGRVSEYAAMLLRRVLQTEAVNRRAAFILAVNLGRSGRIGTARQLMRKIAPLESENGEKTQGLSAAHAWLALATLEQASVIDEAARSQLLGDLESAMSWEGVTPRLVLDYAEQLSAGGDSEKALQVINENIERFPELQIERLKIARGIGNERDQSDAAAAIRLRVPELIEMGEASPEDFADYGSVLVLSGDLDKALKIAGMGLEKVRQINDARIQDVEASKLRRILSEAYRLKYRSTMSEVSDGVSVDLNLLEDSIRADPTNPNTITEVAILVSEGRNATPEMLSSLKEQLAEGRATIVAHLLLSNALIRKGNPEEAIPHLEIVLSRAPQNAIALNNMALCLAMLDSANIPRALQLVEQAVSTAGRLPEILDTKGQILMKKGDFAGAIVCFEDALRRDGSNVETRKQLASAYQQLGMNDFAEEQFRRVDEILGARPTTKSP